MNQRQFASWLILFASWAGGLSAQTAWPPTRAGQDANSRTLPRGGNTRDFLRSFLEGGGGQREVPFQEPQPFPTFPVNLPGFGGFPGLGLPQPFSSDALSELFAPGLEIPRDPNSWPKWISVDASIEAAEGFLPDRAILSASAERVWYLAPTAGAYIPLSFHDKFRLMTQGARVEVRRRGEFQILFHGGARLRSRGPISVVAEALSPERIELRLIDYTNVWVDARERPVHLVLGSGETVRLSDTRGYLRRDGTTGSIEHPGRGMMRIESPVGRLDIPPAHRVEVLADRSRVGSRPRELTLVGDVASLTEGRILKAEAGVGGGAVVWNGARFAVQPGTVLRIDPLGGNSFPDNQVDIQ